MYMGTDQFFMLSIEKHTIRTINIYFSNFYYLKEIHLKLLIKMLEVGFKSNSTPQNRLVR